MAEKAFKETLYDKNPQKQHFEKLKRLSLKTRLLEISSEMSTTKKTATKTVTPAKPKAATPAKEERVDEPKPSVLPNDVLRTITDARKKDPKDKHGDSAFRINYERMRMHQNKMDKKKKSAYIPFEVNIRGQWLPFNLRVMNAKTTAGIKAPEERDLQFRRSSTFTIRNTKGEEEEQKYGEAVCAGYEAFGRLAAKGLADGKLKNTNTTIHSKIQYKINSTGEDLEDPIYRVELRTDRDSNDPQFTDLKDNIRDVRRKLDKIPPGAVMPYDLALDSDDKPLTPATVHTFFRSGTPCFGVHCMDQVSIAGSGFSVPGYFSLLAAKKPKGKRPAFENHFTQEEVQQWADAEAYEEDGDADAGEDGADGAEDGGADAEDGAADAYDDVLDAIQRDASEGGDEATKGSSGDAPNEPDDAALDALEEKTPVSKSEPEPEPTPEPAPAPKKPAAKAAAKKTGKK
jgi:hypothetical protein